MIQNTTIAFELGAMPCIVFGAGRIAELPRLARTFGTRALLVTGAESFIAGPHGAPLLSACVTAGLCIERMTVVGEPSPESIDAAVHRFRTANIDVVIGIGGGSVLDAAKAIAGLLPAGDSVMDFLEGVGRNRAYTGPALPFIAVPTTAGTGAEATKNAVLSRQGKDGFKKSFRHDALVARYALIDPDLLATCPPALIAANGMDALTQLIEAYVSTRANPLTDALAESGLHAAARGLLRWYREPEDAAARADMAYAALLSGIALAHAGLGAVHGLAAPLGAQFPIPHGVVCGSLMAAATEMNLHALRSRAPAHAALTKYARVAEILRGGKLGDAHGAHTALLETLNAWTDEMRLPRLRAYGVTAADYPAIVADCRGNSMRTNPVVLTDTEVTAILAARL